MILFFDKQTGEIVGTIEGRMHKENHMKMWIGDKDKVDRLVVNWKVEKYVSDDKEYTAEDIERMKKANKKAWENLVSKKGLKPVWRPEKHKELIEEVEKDSKRIKEYKIDLETNSLVKHGRKLKEKGTTLNTEGRISLIKQQIKLLSETLADLEEKAKKEGGEVL